MSTLHYPFTALVGLDTIKLALQLAAVDQRLSVLLRGDKGAGKSTAARALGDLLADGSRFVNLPIGATEDRVLGGLDVARALEGQPALKPGLLAAAHGGVLYIDEVNLLPDHLADAMLDAVASGVHLVEREGFSVRQDADFVLVGSMNPEEGALRPQLLDRFALVADVSAPLNPVERRVAVERRLAFDANPARFLGEWRESHVELRATLHQARARAGDVLFPADLLDMVSERVCAGGVRSLRADLAIVRAARALAAIEGAPVVGEEHIEVVLPLALIHRAPAGHASPWAGVSRQPAPSSQAPPAPAGAPPRSSAPAGPGLPSSSGSLTVSAHAGPTPPSASEPVGTLGTPGAPGTSTVPSPAQGPALSQQPDDSPENPPDGPPEDPPDGPPEDGVAESESRRERVFEVRPVATPRIVVDADGRPAVAAAPASRTGRSSDQRGAVIGSRRADDPSELDLRSTMRQALSATGQATPRREHLHEKVRATVRSRRFLFVIDASGSLAAQQRMRLVKGAVAGLLDTTLRRRDEVAVVAFRGAEAEIVLAPTTNLDEARAALSYLPTGGRTPLAHGLALAAGLVTDDTALILLTDGRANVPMRTDDAWADALDAAGRIACPALVIDSEGGATPSGRARALADRMHGTHVALDALDEARLLDLVRPVRP